MIPISFIWVISLKGFGQSRVIKKDLTPTTYSGSKEKELNFFLSTGSIVGITCFKKAFTDDDDFRHSCYLHTRS